MQAVAREGKRLRTAHLDVRVVASPRDHCRVGFVVAKYGHSAVERNRVKRILRELARRRLLGALRQLMAGTAADVVLRAKPEAYRATLSILAAEFDGLAARIARVVAPSASTTDTADTRSAGNS